MVSTTTAKTKAKRATKSKTVKGKAIAAKKKVVASKSKTKKVQAITVEEKLRMIEYTAYMRAEARGFEPGHEMDDWLAAENEVEELLLKSCAQVVD